jgi:hypothetical protein
MADLYLTPAERYTAALGGFYYGDLPEPGTVYTQLIKDILNGATPDKEPKNILARFIYSLYISDLGDPYPRYELAKLLYWKLHDITPTKSGSILTVTIDGKEDYMTINTDLSRLWYKVLFGSKTDVITEFPYIFNTIQNKLSDWELFGNVEVSGTPTHDNPVMPQGTGEKTGNLFDVSNFTLVQVTSTAYRYGTSLGVLPQGEYTFNATKSSGAQSIYLTAKLNGVYSQTTISTVPFTFTADGDSEYIIRTANNTGTTWEAEKYSDMMLNTGSTAMAFKPYGYKIPISSAGQTNNIYLGEVETTRRVRKLVLTGNESGALLVDSTNRIFALRGIFNSEPELLQVGGICTHYKYNNAVSSLASNMQNGDFVLNRIVNDYSFTIKDNSFNTADDFKSYLAQQYSAGTPVCVWYVLATPQTAVVNEPLMKIGEYADSLSRAKTGIDIPTVVGQNTLDVLTTVKPSSMRIEYTSADETKSRSKRISLLKSPLKKGLIK